MLQTVAYLYERKLRSQTFIVQATGVIKFLSPIQRVLFIYEHRLTLKAAISLAHGLLAEKHLTDTHVVPSFG